MIEINKLRFGYDETLLFRDLSVSIGTNIIVALIGPNGSGKTTLMHCMTGMLTPLAGDILIGRCSVRTNIIGVRQLTSYLPDNFGLYHALTVKQHLRFVATAYQIPSMNDRIDQVISDTRLEEFLDRYPSHLSRGQRQRVGIAMAIINMPSLLLLDEPASGLDPSAREDLARLLRSLSAGGMTILVSSHILSELKEYATDYLIMYKGRIEAQGKVKQTNIWRICLEDSNDIEHLLAVLTETKDINTPYQKENEVFFECPDDISKAVVLRDLVEQGFAITEFAQVASDIERIYQEKVI